MAAAAKKAKTIANDEFLDDNFILNDVNPTHTPDGRITAIESLLSATAKILKENGITTLDQELLEENINTQEEIAKTIEAHKPIIHTVACKLACECECSGGDHHTEAITILEAVGCYDWHAKAMIVLTAFAMRYSELCLIATAKKSLVATSAVLKRRPRITENILVLIEEVTKLSKCIADVTCYFDHISDDNFSLDKYKFALPIAAYWIIRSLVACYSHFTSLPDSQYNRSFTLDTDYVSYLVGEINDVYDRINVKLQDCKREIEKKYRESYWQIKILFELQQKTNLQILEGIYDSKDPKPLIHCTNGRVTLEEGLKEKTVMLYVSDLSITTKTEELSMLKTRYTDLCSLNKKQSHRRRYEIVWLPIIDKFTEVAEQTFDELVADMPWYALHPQCLKREAKQYIKEMWMSEKKTSLVVLHKGKVVCHDALHLVRIWKKLDFSFTVEEADSHWRNVSWKLDLFEDYFDAPTKDWVRRNNYICLCGGKDIEWIKELTTRLKRVSQLTKTQLKIVYIGKYVKEVRNQAKVAKYKVDCWDEANICSFWEHLESMWHCKMQHQGETRVTDNNDLIMQELMRMISFGNSEKGWAIFSKGASSNNIVKADEEELLTCLREWSLDPITSEEEFLVNLSTRLSIKMPSVNHHCISFLLPRDAAIFKKELLCAQCKQPMEKFVLCRCCK